MGSAAGTPPLSEIFLPRVRSVGDVKSRLKLFMRKVDVSKPEPGLPPALIALGLAVGLPLFSLHGAVAEPSCPRDWSASKPIVVEDYLGIPLGKEYYFNAHGTWLKIPYGYLNPWPHTRLEEITPKSVDADKIRPAQRIAFVFWMPTLRWPERDPLSVPSFTPCEYGRRIPEDGEYVVEAAIEWPWLSDSRVQEARRN